MRKWRLKNIECLLSWTQQILNPLQRFGHLLDINACVMWRIPESFFVFVVAVRIKIPLLLSCLRCKVAKCSLKETCQVSIKTQKVLLYGAGLIINSGCTRWPPLSLKCSLFGFVVHEYGQIDSRRGCPLDSNSEEDKLQSAHHNFFTAGSWGPQVAT